MCIAGYCLKYSFNLSHVKSGEFKIRERNIIICTCDTCVLNRERSKYTICRALGSPTPFASVVTHYTGTAYTATTNGRVVAKADTLYVTLPSATVSAIAEIPTELAAVVTVGDLPAVNALFERRDGHGGNG